MADEIQEVLVDIRERLVRVETKIDDSLKERLDKIEDNQAWLWKTTIGGIIAGVIAFIFKWGGKL
jgi:hydroxymethylglutaryl-CoA reductase